MEHQQEIVNWLADIDNIKNMDLNADSTPETQSPCATSPISSDSFETVAYDPNSFKNIMTQKDLMDEQSHSEGVRLKNPVRQRLYANGTKKSNAKIRLWSDGSDTFLGSEDAGSFEPQRNLQPFTRHGCCYQPQGFFVEKMTFRPRVEEATHKGGRNADRLARQKFSRLRLEERKTSSSVKMHLQTADEDSPEIMEDDDDDDTDDDDVEELSEVSCSDDEQKYSTDENVEMEELMFNMDSDYE